MTKEQKAAYIVAMAACVNAEIAAMQIENQINSDHGFPCRHDADDFRAVMDRYGIHRNAVLTLFRG